MVTKAAAGGAKIVLTTEGFLEGYVVKDKSISLTDSESSPSPYLAVTFTAVLLSWLTR